VVDAAGDTRAGARDWVLSGGGGGGYRVKAILDFDFSRRHARRDRMDEFALTREFFR